MADAKKSGWHKMSEHPDRKQSNPAVSVDVLIKNKFGRYFVGGYYYDTDEYECSVCGTRCRRSSMVCPKCGIRFEGTMEDDTEFDEEMMEEEDWDEEEGM